jgi:hypothetical protein
VGRHEEKGAREGGEVTRPFSIVDAAQRSPEWYAARSGRLTGSSAGDMLAKIKTGEAAARRDLRLRLVCERLTGQPQDDSFVNDAMQRGLDLEPAARGAYEALTGNVVRSTGFLVHPTLSAGCSLDGDVDDFAGIVELKCPKSSTHLEYLRGGVVPARHIPQITHNLWISGAAWCDFLSYDDRFPEPLQTFYVRVFRNDADIAAYELLVRQFLSEVEAEVESIRGLAAKVA